MADEAPKPKLWAKLKSSIKDTVAETQTPYMPFMMQNFAKLVQSSEQQKEMAAKKEALEITFEKLIEYIFKRAGKPLPENSIEDEYQALWARVWGRLQDLKFDYSKPRQKYVYKDIYEQMHKQAGSSRKVWELLNKKGGIAVQGLAGTFVEVMLVPPKKTTKDIVLAYVKNKVALFKDVDEKPMPKAFVVQDSQSEDSDGGSGMSDELKKKIKFKKVVDKVLKRLMSQVLAQSDSKMDLEKLTFAYIRLAGKVRRSMLGLEFDTSRERIKIIHKAVFREICRNITHIKDVHKFLIFHESMDGLIVECIKKVLLSDQMTLKEKTIPRIVPNDAKKDVNLLEALTSPTDENRQIAIDFVLRKLINHLVDKTNTLLRPEGLQELHSRLLPKILAKMDGCKFKVNRKRFQEMHEDIFRRFCKSCKGFEHHVLTLLEVDHPQLDDMLVHHFKAVLLRWDNPFKPMMKNFVQQCVQARRTTITQVKPRINKFLKMFGYLIRHDEEEMEIEIKAKEGIPVTEDMLHGYLNHTLECINTIHYKEFSERRLAEIHDHVYPHNWKVIQGGRFFDDPEEMLETVTNIFTEYMGHYTDPYMLLLKISSATPLDFLKFVACFKARFLQFPEGQFIPKVYFHL